MRRLIPMLLPVLGVLLLVGACTGMGRPGGVALPTQSSSPTAAAPPVAPRASAQAPQSSDTAVAPSGTALPVPVQTARNFVANLAGVDPGQVQVETFEQVEWGDACLGVPRPGQACAQVVTPGYRIVFTTPKGPYELHTDLTGNNARLASAPTGATSAGQSAGQAGGQMGTETAPTAVSASGPSPLPTGIPLGGILPVPVQALTATLSQKLNVPARDLTLVSAEAVEWPDACLGAPEKGEMCAQVLTPGYRLVFESPSGQYEVHTDQSGQSVRVVKR